MDGLITPKNAFLPFQFRVEGLLVPPTVTAWKLIRVCPQYVTTQVGGEFSVEFEGSEFPTSGGYGPTEIPSSLVISYDSLTDENGDALTDENGDPIFTGEVAVTGETYNLAGFINFLDVETHNGGHNVVYRGEPIPSSFDCGFYEIFIKLSNGLSFWSEVIRITEFDIQAMPFLKIGFSNPVNLEKIVYAGGFENRIYLNSFVAHSEPSLTEEVVKDGLNQDVVIAAVSTDRFVLSELVPDYLKTAISAAPVCRTIYVEEPKTMLSFQASRLRVSSTVEGNGCFSVVELQFEVDNELFRTACE